MGRVGHQIDAGVDVKRNNKATVGSRDRACCMVCEGVPTLNLGIKGREDCGEGGGSSAAHAVGNGGDAHAGEVNRVDAVVGVSKMESQGCGTMERVKLEEGQKAAAPLPMGGVVVGRGRRGKRVGVGWIPIRSRV